MRLDTAAHTSVRHPLYHLGHQQHGDFECSYDTGLARINRTHDEPLLACALVVDTGRRELRPADKRVRNLSKIHRKLPWHDDAAADPTFRSPGGASRQTGDSVTVRARYHGVVTKGGQLSRDVVADFTERTDVMGSAAQEGETSLAREGQLPRH
ncbi:hypothetical protein [Streptomyces sp. HUAS TT20]|uniref:hypothetical protein n=1 Tax=Streptomyces sp. HUAS TT20 TaxID=3447509 RepID=UPI0021DB3704|nr:hypothetical protein [Streptomyces sp. HUAS 15-9]UXY27802.1 hypothetical protein N8I87_15275 [Streptomyces sp. HUAS 15-9]